MKNKLLGNILLCMVSVFWSLVTSEILADEQSATANTATQSQTTQASQNRASAKEPLNEKKIQNIFSAKPEETISLYMLNYGLLSSDDAKMQISFKYRLIKTFGFYFSYTSTILWDTKNDSSPVRDITFSPELFYRYIHKHPAIASIDSGYIHNSNGQDGDDSRGLNRLFVRFNNNFKLNNINLYLVTNLYATYGKSAENQDIADYLGFWDTRLVMLNLFKDHQITLGFKIVSGENGIPFNQGSYMLDALYKIEYLDFNPYLYMQYFNGYGETILNYNQKTDNVRVGIALYF